MKPRWTLQMQLALGLLLALAQSYAFQPAGTTGPGAPSATPLPTSPVGTITATIIPPPEPSASPAPFTTLEGVWMVSVLVKRSAAPQLVDVTYLPQGRLTASSGGGSAARLLAADGSVLYEQRFEPVFLRGEPLQAVDELRLVLILPAVTGAASLQIVTPQGEVSSELPTIR